VSPVPFDRVTVKQGATLSQLSVDAFLALPLSERIRLVLSRAIEFYHGSQPVDRRVALASLRDAHSPSPGNRP